MAMGLFLLCLAVAIFTQGCANTHVDKIVDISPPQSCPKLDMPPIGEDCLLDIRGDKVTANDCGETLLRGYVRARQLLR